jgi:signal transduction histidine kinase
VAVEPLPDGFAVTDTGPGIPRADRDSIFDHGFTTNAEDGGTGFGLAIVEQIAGSHGWTVEYVPDDRGARFAVRGVDTATGSGQ